MKELNGEVWSVCGLDYILLSTDGGTGEELIFDCSWYIDFLGLRVWCGAG